MLWFASLGQKMTRMKGLSSLFEAVDRTFVAHNSQTVDLQKLSLVVTEYMRSNQKRFRQQNSADMKMCTFGLALL